MPGPAVPAKVIVHPLVLLSVVDHYTRVAKDTNRRVVGILLGEVSRGQVDITNCYAVPFEEDQKSPNVWYLDHEYHENMYAMFRKINAREKVVGWYSTGPKIRPADIDIHALLEKYTSQPVYVIVDVNPRDDLEIPTEAHVATEQPGDVSGRPKRVFNHLPCEIGALEAEEVGVEHLLRNIRDISGSSMSDRVNAKLRSLQGLKKRLGEISTYLDRVIDKKMPPNPEVLYKLQDILNLCPDLKNPAAVKAFASVTNDQMLVIYVSSLIRSILALHNLISNKLGLASAAEDKEKEEKQKEKAKEKAKEKEKGKEAAEGKESDKDKAAAPAPPSSGPGSMDTQP